MKLGAFPLIFVISVVSNNMVDVDKRNRLLDGVQRTDLANQYFN